jgi:uncharacterized membrane protein YccF (DUF307 family)
MYACPASIVKCKMGHSKKTLIDVWSLVHSVWGGIIGTIVWLTSPLTSFVVVLSAAILFEIFENSKYGITLFKECFSKEEEYNGDNFWNSFTDIIFNMIGWNIVCGIYDPVYLIGGFVWGSAIAIIIIGWYLQNCN